MGNRMLAATFLAAGVAASALAGDVVARAGRWETTGEITYGPQRPQGMREKERYTDLDCISKAFELNARAPLPPPDETCKVDNYRKERGSVKFTFVCDEVTFDFELTPQGPDAYSGIVAARGTDASVNFSARFTSKRTAARCSAREIEEQGEN